MKALRCSGRRKVNSEGGPKVPAVTQMWASLYPIPIPIHRRVQAEGVRGRDGHLHQKWTNSQARANAAVPHHPYHITHSTSPIPSLLPTPPPYFLPLLPTSWPRTLPIGRQNPAGDVKLGFSKFALRPSPNPNSDPNPAPAEIQT